MTDQVKWWKKLYNFSIVFFFLQIFCIDFSDSVKIIFQSIFSYIFNENILFLPSLGVSLEAAEHITYYYVDKNDASSWYD